jgi:inorganic pyrophosphatase/exopolyphosphatase
MSTTTPDDLKAVEYLAPIAAVDPVPFGMRLLEKGSRISQKLHWRSVLKSYRTSSEQALEK